MFNLQITAIENEILQSCTYILSRLNHMGVYLVDCGDVSPILSFLERNNKVIEGVLLTHCHYDHIYGLKELLIRFPNLNIFASNATFIGLEDEELSMSYLYSDDEYVVHLNEEQKTRVCERADINILGEFVECIPTPGHDVDCMSYIIGNALFTGDSYNPNSPVFTKWHNSDADIATKNEFLLKEMIIKRRLQVYPGHRIDINKND